MELTSKEIDARAVEMFRADCILFSRNCSAVTGVTKRCTRGIQAELTDDEKSGESGNLSAG